MKQIQGDFVFTYTTRTAGSHTVEMRLVDQDHTLCQTGNLKLTEAEEMRNVLNVLAC